MHCLMDHAVPLAEVEVEDGLLVVAFENQGCWVCGPRIEDLGEDDPQVVVDLSDFVGGSWEALLSEFLQQFLTFETVIAGSTPDSGGPLGEYAPGVQGRLLPFEVHDYGALFATEYVDGTHLCGDERTLLANRFALTRGKAARRRLAERLGEL